MKATFVRSGKVESHFIKSPPDLILVSCYVSRETNFQVYAVLTFRTSTCDYIKCMFST